MDDQSSLHSGAIPRAGQTRAGEAMHQAGLAAAQEAYQKGRLSEVRSICSRVLQRDPTIAGVWHLLGVVFDGLGEFSDAIRALKNAVALEPNSKEARCSLALSLQHAERTDEAESLLRMLLGDAPEYGPAWNNLGVLLLTKNCAADAERCFRKALECRALDSRAMCNLGNALREQGRLHEALVQHHAAIQADPTYGPAFDNCAATLSELGRTEDALEVRRRLVDLEPQDPVAHSRLLFTLLHVQSTTPQLVFEEHLRWARRHCSDVSPSVAPPHVHVATGRRLRVGYVSPDFCGHATVIMFASLLAAHDKAAVHVTCYGNVTRPDQHTARIQSLGDSWRQVDRLSDDQLAQSIKADQIDVLVDLAGHTQGNRLLTFARRPAPIQLAYLGYPSTTGLRQIDYCITDPWLDPDQGTQAWHSERLLKLPRCFCCYEPAIDAPLVSASPFTRNGYVTFGLMNRPIKITRGMLGLWAQILRKVPRSKLLIKALSSDTVQHLAAELAKRGIDVGRIGWLPPASRAGYLASFGQIDIALDTFPYHGTTTTCESFWMGVPVVSLVGSSRVSRVGLSLSSAVGLPELACGSGESYVSTVLDMAGDPSRLSAMRSQLRGRMLASPLRDAQNLARSIEEAYSSVFKALAGAQRTC